MRWEMWEGILCTPSMYSTSCDGYLLDIKSEFLIKKIFIEIWSMKFEIYIVYNLKFKV